MNMSKSLRFESIEDIERAFLDDPRSMRILMGIENETPEQRQARIKETDKLMKALGHKTRM